MVTTAAALLAACGVSQPPIGATSEIPQSRAIAAKAERGRIVDAAEGKDNQRAPLCR